MSSNNADTSGLSHRQIKRRAQAARRKKNNARQDTTKPAAKKFVGMDTGAMSGIVITKTSTTPLPQQYDALYNALLTYAGSRPKGGGKAKKSLKNMKRLTKQKDFDPPMPTEDQYTIIGKDGTPQINEVIQQSLLQRWNNDCDANNKPYMNYNETMVNLFNIVVGQLGPEIIMSLKGVDNWDDIDEENDIVGLLKELKIICYRDDINKVDIGVDVLRKVKKLVTMRLRDANKTASEHVDEVANRMDVLKASGITITSPTLVKHVLRVVFKSKHTYKDYLKWWSASADSKELKLKDEIDDAVRQLLVGRMTVEAADDALYDGIRKELERDFSKAKKHQQDDVYSDTAAEVTTVLSRYRVNNRRTRGTNDQTSTESRGNRNKIDKENDKTKEETDKDKTDSSPDEESMHMIHVSPNRAVGGGTDIAHQLLMSAIEADVDEDSDEEEYQLFMHANDGEIDNDWTYCDPHERYITEEQPSGIKPVEDNDEYHCGGISNEFYEGGQNGRNPNDERFTYPSVQYPRDVADTRACTKKIERLKITRSKEIDFHRSPGRLEQTSHNRGVSDRNDVVHNDAESPRIGLSNVVIKQCYRWLRDHVAPGIAGHDDQKVATSVDLTDAYLFAQAQGRQLNPSWLLLDSQASVNIICNENLVTNIRIHPDGKKINVNCNTGSVELGTIADMKGYGEVWFHKEGIANCLSLALISDQYRITLDTAIDQAFYLHRGDGTTRRFSRVSCNLYVCDLSERTEMVLVTTVAGKKLNYSNLDVRRATAARRLQEIMNYPSTASYIKMVDNNAIKNCSVTRRDIKMSEDIFGENPSMVKGKMVWKQPEHVREDIPPVPPEILDRYGEVTLSIDVYYINKCTFLRAISRHIMLRTTIPMSNARKPTLLKKLKTIINLYRVRGFIVTDIHGDNQFTCLEDDLATPPLCIKFHPVAANSHEPFIERDNRTSKERCRCTIAGLPYKRYPRRMIMEMPRAADFWLNNWCSSSGISDTIPPRQLITGIQLDEKKHCKFQYGDYVLGYSESNNDMTERATDGIFLRPTGSIDGAFYMMSLKTGERLRKLRGRLAHVTAGIIRRVEEIAEQEGMPIGFIMEDRDHNITTQINIGDLDTEPIASEDDDDNASDMSYVPDDDESVDSVLTGVVSESSETNNGHEEINPDDAVNHHEVGVDDDGENSGVDDHPDELEDNENADDPDIILQNQDEAIEFEDNTDDAVGTEETTHEPNDTRRSLRTRVERINAKTYEPETHHRHAFFTRGFSEAVKKIERDHQVYCFIQKAVESYNSLDASLVTPQYNVEKGLKIFKELGRNAVTKELRQLHDMEVVTPMHIKDLTEKDVKNALPYLMYLKRKRCGKIKGRGCADGRAQREFISKDEASSPTASLYAIILTSLTDAIEGRYVVTTDIPGAFLQTEMPADEDPIYIRFTGSMVELLERIDPELYSRCVITTRKGRKVLYARANKAIYGTLKAALLFWKKLKGQLAAWGFEQNPYDQCTMNKIIDGKQATIVWHVDDLKISHVSKNVVDKILKDLEEKFGGQDGLSTTTGDVHDYLGMTIDYRDKGMVKITMFDYLSDIIATLPERLQTKRNCNTPAADHLFEVNENAEKLDKKDSELFHRMVAKLLFAAKRARPDIQTAISFLCTRVKAPDVDDWKKLIRVLGYVKQTVFLPLTIGWDHTGNIYWYVDASFAVHNDMRSHTGGVMTFGKGAALSMSTKQKINTKSSTEAELVGVDDTLPFNVWCKYFLQSQGYHAHQVNENDRANDKLQYLGHRNILYQDNTSAIRLERNGKASSTKRTRHLNIRYFLITDKLNRQEINTIEYCPTTEMLGDIMTKPLQGSLFTKFRNAIMGCSDAEYLRYKMDYEENGLKHP